MINRSALCTAFFAGLFCLLAAPRLAAQSNEFPLELQTMLEPPYPVFFSDYQDIPNRLVLHITRTSFAEANRTYPVYFRISLRNDRGDSAESIPGRLPSQPTEVPPEPTPLLVYGYEIENLQAGLNQQDFEFAGFDPNLIFADQALPEGNYSFCVTAYLYDIQNPNVQLSSGTGMSCVEFPITYYQQPQLVEPCPREINLNNDPFLNVSWFTPGLPGTANVEYKLHVTIVPENVQGNDPLALVNNTALTTEEVEVFGGGNTYQFDLTSNDPVPWTPGWRYVLRVRATSGEVAFQNNGYSDPCLITVAGGGGSSGFEFEAHYPGNETTNEPEWLPFRQFPVIAVMSDYSDDYSRFDYHTYIRRDNTPDGVTDNDDFQEDNNWYPTPIEAQGLENYPRSIAEVRARHLPVYKAPGNNPITLARGAPYVWWMSGRVEQRNNGPVLQDECYSNRFYAGMPAPQLNTPEHDARFEVDAPITFNWRTGEAPEHLFPDIPDIVRRSGSGSGSTTSGFHYGPVDERWVLQVARDSQFTQLVDNGTRSEPLQVDAFTISDPAESSAKRDLIYKAANSGATPFRLPEGTYWWRVGWLSDPANPGSVFYQVSEKRRFCVGAGTDCQEGNNGGGGDTDNEPERNQCYQNCEIEVIPGEALPIEVGDNIRIGKFYVKVKEITRTEAGHKHFGKGEIDVIRIFGKDFKAKVDFENLQVKLGNVAFAGEAKATGGGELENITGLFDGYVTVPFGWDEAIDNHKVVLRISEMVFKPTGASLDIEAGYEMPGEFAGHPVRFKADDVCFHPGGFAEKLKIYLDKDLIIGDRGEGLGADSETPPPDNFQVVFKGKGTANNLDNATYIEFDCDGFRCLQIKSFAVFPREWMVPENTETAEPLPTGNVRCLFETTICRSNAAGGVIGMVSFDKPFQIAGLPRWSFSLSNVWLDLTEQKNPENMQFPTGYDPSRLQIQGVTAQSDPRLVKTWTGFYAQNIAVRLPPEFNGPDAGRLSFNVNNLIIDKSGLSVQIGVRDVVSITDGQVRGFKFSIEEIALGIVQNTSVSGSMRGKMGLPVFEPTEENPEPWLDWSTALTLNFDGGNVAYNLDVRVPENKVLSMPMWDIATASLSQGSRVALEISSNDVAIGVTLCGALNFGGDMTRGSTPVPGMNMMGIEFQDLRFGVADSRGGFYFDEGSIRLPSFSQASPQHSTAGFPINIGGISPQFGNDEQGRPRLGLQIDLRLLLNTGSNFSAAGKITFWAVANNFDIGNLNRLSIDWGGIQVDSISISGDVGGGISLGGYIAFYSENQNGVKKDGVKGEAFVRMPMNIGANLFVEFGTVRSCASCDFNTAGYYPYFAIDALVSFDITVFTGVNMKGIGGGIWYNMTMSSEAPMADAVRRATNRPGRSGVAFRPEYGNFGFRLRALFGPPGESGLYAIQATVAAQIDMQRGALDFISVRGDAWIMAENQNNLSQAPITASLEFTFDNQQQTPKFYGWLDVAMSFDVAGVVSVKGRGQPGNKLVVATFYAADDGFHFWFGHMYDNTMDNRQNPPRSVSRGGFTVNIVNVVNLEFQAYFMVGNGIPAELPPLPREVEEMLNGADPENRERLGEQALSSDPRTTENTFDPTTDVGDGLAFGAHLYLRLNPSFLIFYADLQAWLGVDVSIVRRPVPQVCTNTGREEGWNGWRANGQAYVALRGELGIGVDIPFICERCRIPIIELGAAVALSAQLPNPEYFSGRVGLQYNVLGGLVSGRCNFQVEVGEKCETGAGPLEGITFIGDMKPGKPGGWDVKQRNVDVFVKPTVSFNIKMEEFPLQRDDGRMCCYRPILAETKVFDRNGTAVALRSGESVWSNDRTVLTIKPNEALRANTDYRFSVKIAAEEQCEGSPGWRPLAGQNNSGIIESGERFFRTGDVRTLPDEQVLYAYPLKRQRYYLQGERPAGNSNFLRVDQWQQDLLSGSNYKYEINVRKIDGTLLGTQPAGMNRQSRAITFRLPDLAGEQVYIAQLVRSRTGKQPASPLAGLVRYKPLHVDLASNTSGSTAQINQRVLIGEIVEPGQEFIYALYFRTSRYHTMTQKLAGLNFGNVERVNDNQLAWLEAAGNTGSEEDLDFYDLSGVRTGNYTYVMPLVSVTASWADYPGRETAEQRLYQPWREFFQNNQRLYMAEYGMTQSHGVNHNGWVERPVSSQSVVPPPVVGLEWVRRPSSSSRLSDYELGISDASPVSWWQLLGVGGSYFSDRTFRLAYRTPAVVNQQRAALLGDLTRVESSKFLYRSAYTPSEKLIRSVNDVERWLVQHPNQSKGNCTKLLQFNRSWGYHVSGHIFSHYLPGINECQTPAGPFGWDSQGVITGAIQPENRMSQAEMHQVVAVDLSNRQIIGGIRQQLVAPFGVPTGSYRVRFTYLIPGLTLFPHTGTSFERTFTYWVYTPLPSIPLLLTPQLGGSSIYFNNNNINLFKP